MRLNKYYPLCFVAKDVLLLYKNGSLFLYNVRTSEFLKQRKVIFSIKETLLARFSLFYRFFRCGARVGTYIGNDTALINIGLAIFEVNTKTLEMSKGYSNGISRPLSFGVVSDIEGFDDAVFFGDYYGNLEKRATSIYKRIGVDQWEKVFTFAKGEINHIHNIVPDESHQCIWVFTGDFENGTGIWRTIDNFKTVEPVLRGNQLHRGVVAFPMKDGILYATDAPYADDFIMRLHLVSEPIKGEVVESLSIDGEGWVLEKLCPINGSCIYGTQINDNTYIFETSVEPDGRQNQNKWVFFFGRKRGSGIKDDYVYIYAGNPDDGFKPIYQSKKDSWPYIAFQFGTFRFPEGMNRGNFLPFFSMATKDHNLELQIIEL